MEFEFMTADTVLPPCMPLPTAILRLPVSSTAKVMKELEDAGLILRVRRGVGEPNRIYTLLPKKEGCCDE